MKSLTGLLCAVAALLLTQEGRADSSSGPGLQLLAGGGYASGAYRYVGMSHPGYGVPVQQLAFDTRLAGLTQTIALDLGWRFDAHVALWADISATIQLKGGGKGDLSGTQIEQVPSWQTQLLADVHPSARSGWHVQVGAGVQKATFLSSTQDYASYDNIVRTNSVSGGVGTIGLGYDFTRLWGLVMRLSYTELSNSAERYRPVTLGVLATLKLF